MDQSSRFSHDGSSCALPQGLSSSGRTILFCAGTSITFSSLTGRAGSLLPEISNYSTDSVRDFPGWLITNHNYSRNCFKNPYRTWGHIWTESYGFAMEAPSFVFGWGSRWIAALDLEFTSPWMHFFRTPLWGGAVTSPTVKNIGISLIVGFSHLL